MTTPTLDIPAIDPATGLPKLYPLAQVAEMLGRDYGELRDAAQRREFEYIQVSRQNRRMTAPQIYKLIDYLTRQAASADPGVDRDRERVARQRNRAAAPKPRSRKAA
jgi:hypothetical protein